MPWYGWVIMFCFYMTCQTVMMVSVVMTVRGRKIVSGQTRTSSGKFASPIRDMR